eukprot:scaffold39983_cov29-Attheya_sp.AAC.2
MDAACFDKSLSLLIPTPTLELIRLTSATSSLNLFTFEVARFHVAVLGVTPYLSLYVAVSPDCQSDGSDPFRFSSWFFVRFANKSEILSLVAIPFKMTTNRAAMAIPVDTFTLCIIPVVFLME